MDLFHEAIEKKVLMNIQCDCVEECEQLLHTYGRCFLTGIVAKSFPSLEEGVALIRRMQDAGVPVSAGLGDGSAIQWERALELAKLTDPEHLNEVFPAAALSQAVLKAQGCRTLVNALVRPTGTPGMVSISTGPLSEKQDDAVIPMETAAAMMAEVGISSVKFYHIQGDARLEEVRAVAEVAGKYNMVMEPTGGITPENVAAVVKTCLDAGATCIMPHIYGSLKNKTTGKMDLEKFRRAYEAIRSVAG